MKRSKFLVLVVSSALVSCSTTSVNPGKYIFSDGLVGGLLILNDDATFTYRFSLCLSTDTSAGIWRKVGSSVRLKSSDSFHPQTKVIEENDSTRKGFTIKIVSPWGDAFERFSFYVDGKSVVADNKGCVAFQECPRKIKIDFMGEITEYKIRQRTSNAITVRLAEPSHHAYLNDRYRFKNNEIIIDGLKFRRQRQDRR